MNGAAAGYVRVSTDEQAAEGVSLDAQEARIRAYAALAGLEVTHIYRDEGVSAGKPLATRPAGGELAAAARGGHVRHVITAKLDRIFRDAADCLATTQQWDRAGVALHLIDLGGSSVNSASAMGRFFLGIIAGVAELERNLIRERTSAALQYKKARGEQLGAPPLGFRREDGELVADAQELELVRLILDLRGRRRLSYRAICTELTARGFSPKRGGAWHPQSVRKLWDARARYEVLLLDAA